MRFSKVISAIALVLFIHVVLIFLDIYGSMPNVDVPMHFAGGVAMAILGTYVLEKTGGIGLGFWHRLIFILGFVMLVGVGWEFMEYGLDQMADSSPRWTQMTLRDTLGDLFMDTLGALTYFISKLWLGNR